MAAHTPRLPPRTCPHCDAPCTQAWLIKDDPWPLVARLYECGAVLMFGYLDLQATHPKRCPRDPGGPVRMGWHLATQGSDPPPTPPEVVKRPIMARPPRGSIVPAPGDNRDPG